MSAPRHTEGATEVEREAFLLEGVSVINALITVADCRLDRNQEFYDAEQWKARALSAITPESAPNDATDERTHLRAQQAATVMPQIGPLLDAWEGIDNDTKGTIREEAPELAKWLGSINRAMEGDAALTQPTTVQAASTGCTVLRGKSGKEYKFGEAIPMDDMPLTITTIAGRP